VAVGGDAGGDQAGDRLRRTEEGLGDGNATIASGGGFGRDSIFGFDHNLDRIEFVGYRPQDLVGIDTHAEQSSQDPNLLTVWHFAFVDGSDLTVELVQAQAPSGPAAGTDYIFMS
jgi:hypothetical protein